MKKPCHVQGMCVGKVATYLTLSKEGRDEITCMV